MLKLSLEQRKRLLRKAWKIVLQIVLPLLPLPVLLFAGLIYGPIPGITTYLPLLILTSILLWWIDRERRPPWKKHAIQLGLPLGLATLFTGDVWWFQLELSIVGGLALLATMTKWLRGKPALPDFGFESLLDASTSQRLKFTFLAGSLAIAVVNGWLIANQPFEVWLWFRCLAVFGLVIAVTALTMTKLSRANSDA